MANNFLNRKASKKGKLGEDIVDEYLLNQGFIPYRSIADKAHPFDRLVASADKKAIFVAESKSKPARIFYPDTGINESNYLEYLNIMNTYRMEVFIYFVDEKAKKIYGNKLSELHRPQTVKVHGIPTQYPRTESDHNNKRIIYFPLCAMVDIALLTDDQANALSNYRESRWLKDENGIWYTTDDKPSPSPPPTTEIRS